MYTIMAVERTIMADERSLLAPLAMLRLQSWLSPALPIGAYSYSHGIEWAVEAGDVHDCGTLIDWLAADLRYGSGRNEAILFTETWRCVRRDDRARLCEIAALAAALRGTAELALESSQQAIACLATLRRVWPDEILDWLAATLREREIRPALPVVIGARAARERIPLAVLVCGYLQSYAANLVTAGVRLVPLGQTAGQLAIAALEQTVLAASAEALEASIEHLGSCAFGVDLASMAHETQYTRLFRS
jgi:urease accessory protein